MKKVNEATVTNPNRPFKKKACPNQARHLRRELREVLLDRRYKILFVAKDRQWIDGFCQGRYTLLEDVRRAKLLAAKARGFALGAGLNPGTESWLESVRRVQYEAQNPQKSRPDESSVFLGDKAENAARDPKSQSECHGPGRTNEEGGQGFQSLHAPRSGEAL